MATRKYLEIWKKIKSDKACEVTCEREATVTVIEGVKREKVKDRDKEFKKGKKLEIKVTEGGVLFKLVRDMSINNL